MTSTQIDSSVQVKDDETIKQGIIDKTSEIQQNHKNVDKKESRKRKNDDLQEKSSNITSSQNVSNKSIGMR